MRPISEMIGNLNIDLEKQKIKVLYPRQELMKRFVDRLEKDRVSAGLKKLGPKHYVVKMYDAGLKTDFLLNWFYGYCDDANSFGKCWWWSLSDPNKKKKVIHS